MVSTNLLNRKKDTRSYIHGRYQAICKKKKNEKELDTDTNNDNIQPGYR